MEKGLDRIKKILEENCGPNINFREFFYEFLEKGLYEGHYTDELKAMVDKYAVISDDTNEN
jgi:hypothetical protein